MNGKNEKKRNWALSFFMLFSLLSLFCVPVFAADKTVGVIMTGDIPYYQEIHKAFLEGMSAQGLGPDKVEVYLQKPSPDPMSWTNAARKFTAFEVDVIVCYGASATLAAIKEGSKIPVLYAGVFDPQASQLNGSKATGISSKVPMATVIKNLKSISGFSRLGVMLTPTEKDTAIQANEIRKLESKFGFESVMLDVQGKSDVEKVSGIDALFLTTSAAAMSNINHIVAVTRQSKIPTAAAIGGGEESGIILTIAADPIEQGTTLAKMVGQAIQGTKPSSMPCVQPKKVNMVINLKEAAGMGFKISFGLLSSATQVIK